ncbi:nuclear transport factor 2 family protein [Vibrio neptunius]|uniref:Nuclear transport factor 2 family protein n=1 Tax=Vibrio neptunius TaxID=170651 RepID=A0ABS3A869_9VIBR|nr:nuclear transport factor 2 family protein [Vibrio neptunius]MBN3495586.1 nuclear transport factor 2 family protein [Vibrio neptunius]MBN3518052.1 nuclear transport factor 2 family protein [Vibrio neptunius]MBN3552393.1 nuclear transport factor 2 family protein [Vibrio neptunius]MBN3580429.1 nuclear transport factor 2 family protein [Vibrio neptunius]MCH9874096.1 nuclear transport factor 2 family protein [Vibrio neptunius]
MLTRTISTILLLLTTTSYAQSSNKLTINLHELQKPSWTEQERANAELITDFVQNLMNDHNFDYVLEHYNDSAYIQHNRNLPDKVTGLVGFLRDFVEEYPDYTYDVKHIYVDGDYVIFHSHATLDKEDRGNDEKGMNIIDTWRLEDGRIVEHWDSIQALDFSMRLYSLLSGGDIQNGNGVF